MATSVSDSPGRPAADPRRDAILDAALDAFLELGIVGTSVNELCRRSGASVGSLYHRFGDKEGVAAAVYTRALAAYQAAFAAELRRHDEAEAGVRGVVRLHLRWCLRDHDPEARYLLSAGEAVRGGAAAKLNALNRAFFAEVHAWWRPHARYGALRPLDLALAYALWLGPAQEYCRLRLFGATAHAPRSAAPVLADGAWNALRARPQEKRD